MAKEENISRQDLDNMSMDELKQLDSETQIRTSIKPGKVQILNVWEKELTNINTLVGFPVAKADDWETNEQSRYTVQEFFESRYPEIEGIIGPGEASSQIAPGTWVGSLLTLDPKTAYYIKLRSSPGGNTITIRKNVVMYIKPGSTYELKFGLNFVSYPKRIPQPIEEVFPPDMTYYVKQVSTDFEAAVSLPAGIWVGSLNEFKPNQGYLIQVDNLTPSSPGVEGEVLEFNFPRQIDEEQQEDDEEEGSGDEPLPDFGLGYYEQGNCPIGDYEINGECYFAEDIETLQDFIDISNQYCEQNDCPYNPPGYRDPLNLCAQQWGSMVVPGFEGYGHPMEYADVPENRLMSFTCIDPDIICGEPYCEENQRYSLFGEIPDSIVNWTELRRFDIQDHLLTGIIPAGFQSMSKLYRFELRGTDIQGFEAQGFFDSPDDVEIVGNVNDICNENHFNYWGNIGCTNDNLENNECPEYNRLSDFKLHYNCIGVCPPPNVGDGTLDLNNDGIMEGPAPYCMMQGPGWYNLPQKSPAQCDCDGVSRSDDDDVLVKSPKLKQGLETTQCNDPIAFNYNPVGVGCSHHPMDFSCCEYYIGNMR